jgi:hypothetical protein
MSYLPKFDDMDYIVYETLNDFMNVKASLPLISSITPEANS